MQLTPDEIEVVKKLIADHGSDSPSLESDELRPLAEKLGVWEPEVPPTAEELARREAFAQSPLGKQMIEMFARSAEWCAKEEAERLSERQFWESDAVNGYQWPEGTLLRIRLPNDFTVKKSEV